MGAPGGLPGGRGTLPGLSQKHPVCPSPLVRWRTWVSVGRWETPCCPRTGQDRRGLGDPQGEGRMESRQGRGWPGARGSPVSPRAALEGDAYRRIKLVLQWYLSGFYKKPKVRGEAQCALPRQPQFPAPQRAWGHPDPTQPGRTLMVPTVAPGPQRWGQRPDPPPRDPLARPGLPGWSWFPAGPKRDRHTLEKHTRQCRERGFQPCTSGSPLGPVVFVVCLIFMETFLRTQNAGPAEHRVLGVGEGRHTHSWKGHVWQVA